MDPEVTEVFNFVMSILPWVALILAVSVGGWVFTTWLRIKNGYPLENEWGGSVQPISRGDDDAMRALKTENEQLKTTVGKLEDRLKVLERIATDPTKRLADEIDELR
jgi:hypothetical protein